VSRNGDEDLEIQAARHALRGTDFYRSRHCCPCCPPATAGYRPRCSLLQPPSRWLLLLVAVVASMLESVPLDVRPNDARVRTPGHAPVYTLRRSTAAFARPARRERRA